MNKADRAEMERLAEEYGLKNYPPLWIEQPGTIMGEGFKIEQNAGRRKFAESVFTEGFQAGLEHEKARSAKLVEALKDYGREEEFPSETRLNADGYLLCKPSIGSIARKALADYAKEGGGDAV